MIVFENDAVQIHHAPAPSTLAIIAFGPLGGVPNERTFWGKPLFDKMGYESIGVVLKKPTWYIFDGLSEAISIISKNLQNKDIITYGASMGGYAALKHSRSLRAKCAISFSPQFSIDPTTTGNINSNHHKHFIYDLHSGMDITNEDVIGNAFIVYDRHFVTDEMNVHLIREAVPSVKTLSTPFLGHEAVRAFTSSDLWTKLLPAALAGDASLMQVLLTNSRRKSVRRALVLAEQCSIKRPETANKIFEARKNELSPSERGWFYNRVSIYYFRKGQYEQARHYAYKWLNEVPDSIPASEWLQRVNEIT